MSSSNVVSLSKPKSKKVNVKDQLKGADEATVVKLVQEVADRVKTTRPEKWKHDVVGVLSQKRPLVNSKTRAAYQEFVYIVCASTERVNSELFGKAREFASGNGLEWKRS